MKKYYTNVLGNDIFMTFKIVFITKLAPRSKKKTRLCQVVQYNFVSGKERNDTLCHKLLHFNCFFDLGWSRQDFSEQVTIVKMMFD